MSYSDEEFEEEAADNLVAKPMFSKEEEAGGVVEFEEEEEESDDEENLSEEDDALRQQNEKLRMANEALRKQLKEFAKAFDAALSSKGDKKHPTEIAPRKRLDDDGKKSLRAIVASKQKQVQNLQKKLEMYKRSNDQLKRQIQQVYTADRIVQMGNENKEKERQIQKLVEENRNLAALQRSQAKKMQQHDVGREEWPARLSGLQDELRVARETLRKYKEKAKQAEDEGNKQREQIIRLQERNRELKKEIERYESSNGKVKTKDDMDLEAQQGDWEKERQKLEHSIDVLKKLVNQERNKALQSEKRAEDKYKHHQKEVDKLKAKIEEKEKDMRYQVLQIKKLKRGLRELAMGDGPLPGVDTPWSANMSKFLNGVDDEDDLEDQGESSTGFLDVARSPKSPKTTPASPQRPLKARPEKSSRGPRIARDSENADTTVSIVESTPRQSPAIKPSSPSHPLNNGSHEENTSPSESIHETNQMEILAENDEDVSESTHLQEQAEVHVVTPVNKVQESPEEKEEVAEESTTIEQGQEETKENDEEEDTISEEKSKPEPEKKSAFAKPSMAKKKKKKIF